MGFLDILKTVGKVGLNIATGGVGGAIGAVGDVLGKQQAGAGQAMVQQANAQQNQDRNAISLYQAQNQAQQQAAQTDLDRKKNEAQHQSTAGKEALIAMLLGNHTPSQVSVQGIPQAQISGGMGAALKNPQILELLSSIAAKNQTSATAPVSYSGGAPVAAPTLTPLPETGKSGGILNNIARIAQIAGAVGPSLPQKKKPGTGIDTGNGDWVGE